MAEEPAAQPGGAWGYHQGLVQASAAKPIRVWLEVGDRDLYNPNPRVHDDWHDWTRASENLAKALEGRGHHVQFVFARNAGHSDGPVRRQTLPQEPSSTSGRATRSAEPLDSPLHPRDSPVRRATLVVADTGSDDASLSHSPASP